jgi:hypothetical protein
VQDHLPVETGPDEAFDRADAMPRCPCGRSTLLRGITTTTPAGSGRYAQR